MLTGRKEPVSVQGILVSCATSIVCLSVTSQLHCMIEHPVGVLVMGADYSSGTEDEWPLHIAAVSTAARKLFVQQPLKHRTATQGTMAGK